MHNIFLTRIRRKFPDNSLTDLKREIRKELSRLPVLFKPGSSVAIGVGSRGIGNLPLIVSEVVGYIKQNDGRPFIIPAMGSHGGATASGQAAVLESFGITDKSMGAPVRSSMEVAELPKGNCINPVYMDKNAYDSDGVILINKVKPHTDFHGPYESGLVKMSVIGLGKEKGATAIHDYGVYGLRELIPPSAKQILSAGKILAGIAVVENAWDKIMLVRALSADKIMQEETGLLEIARSNLPSFPADEFDLLIVNRMGKNISGVGMDTNIIGRLRIFGQEEPAKPRIRSIVVTDLTDESHGNASGIGLADVITKHLYDKIDFEFTYKNIATSSFLERGKIPLVAENGREAYNLAIRNCGISRPGEERIIRIEDTLHLHELYVSKAIIREIGNKSDVEILQDNMPLFTDDNEFCAF